MNVFLNLIELLDYIWDIVFYFWCYMLRVVLFNQIWGDLVNEYFESYVR